MTLMNKDIIASKAELLNLLENYKALLHQDCIAYLNGLIELEFSILNTQFPQIVPDDFIEQVARYNIFNRAIKLATECNPQTEIIANRKKGQLYILYKGYKIFSCPDLKTII